MVAQLVDLLAQAGQADPLNAGIAATTFWTTLYLLLKTVMPKSVSRCTMYSEWLCDWEEWRGGKARQTKRVKTKGYVCSTTCEKRTLTCLFFWAHDRWVESCITMTDLARRVKNQTRALTLARAHCAPLPLYMPFAYAFLQPFRTSWSARGRTLLWDKKTLLSRRASPAHSLHWELTLENYPMIPNRKTLQLLMIHLHLRSSLCSRSLRRSLCNYHLDTSSSIFPGPYLQVHFFPFFFFRPTSLWNLPAHSSLTPPHFPNPSLISFYPSSYNCASLSHLFSALRWQVEKHCYCAATTLHPLAQYCLGYFWQEFPHKSSESKFTLLV